MSSIILPELGEGIANATVACWHAKVGDCVTQDEDVVELVTDKASFCVPAPITGTLQEIWVGEGQSAAVGATLGNILT